MRISIITPYKNAAEYLPRCMESLTTQPNEFEFILVNDGSTDDGPDIVKGYAAIDDRIITLDNERSAGVSGARNTGIDHATGDYITFLDADDELLTNAYKTFLHVMNVDANIYQFNHLRYYSKLDKTVLKYTNEGGFYKLPKLPVHWFGVWNKLFNAEFINKNNIRFNEALQYGEDGLFVLYCLKFDGAIYHAAKSKTTVKHYFDNPCSLSKVKTLPDILEQINCYENLLLIDADPKLKRAICLEMAQLFSTIAKKY